MQISSYDWFIDREKNKPCLVAGLAPTIEDFPYKKFDGIYLTCNDGPIRLKDLFQANYWVNATTGFPDPVFHSDIINSFPETVFIFADSVCYRNKHLDIDFLRNNLKVKWFAYDQSHFNHQPCPGKFSRGFICCELIDIYPERDTLQELIQKRYHTIDHYSPGNTVAIHVLAFAIILGCNPIYLQGIEIPVYKHEYIHRGESKTCISDEKSVFYQCIPRILADFKYLIDLAYANSIEVYNLSRTSTLNKINNLKYKDPTEIL
ncbi:hypothetical protein GM661_06755 [Iocasia frigidifontis]|uniref:Uncharacterized protein n=1 Tax=Iocasia fonsfrigidae TaxID=2682810 RepID=A0A8A7K7L6_9FIRM|nr:hypothetical protein [Iocasia fonsfrigidae]QTL97706.1 hypothetical protein GM661_06755 [Iocasia fonsfrigidae]